MLLEVRLVRDGSKKRAVTTSVFKVNVFVESMRRTTRDTVDIATVAIAIQSKRRLIHVDDDYFLRGQRHTQKPARPREKQPDLSTTTETNTKNRTHEQWRNRMTKHHKREKQDGAKD